jgi:hypothetical protein
LQVNSFSRRSGALLAVLLCTASSASSAENWQSTLTAGTPGSFPPLRPLHANYRFGWSGVTAATGDVRLTKTAGNQYVLDGKVRTTDFVRSLWNFEADLMSVADATTLRPIEVKQNESVRAKKVSTTLAFNAQGVSATRTDSAKHASKVTRLDMANLFDLQSALLFLRSQPLANGSVQRIVVFPAKDPYLATMTVEGREKLTIAAGSFNAIKFDLKLSKIGRSNELKPHKKFKKATVWLSDDPDRMLLRAEAEVFIGSVFAELQSVEYEAPQLRHD